MKKIEIIKKFINFIEKKTNLEISSQLYQDMFAEFILEQNTSKIFINLELQMDLIYPTHIL